MRRLLPGAASSIQIEQLSLAAEARYANSMKKPVAKVAKIPAPPKPGVYSRGSDTVDAILKAALEVLIEEGGSAFTLRRIATECGMKVGNVSRHFPKKEMLVQVLLEELLSPTEVAVRTGIVDTGMAPDQALALIIEGSIDEMASKKLTHLFTELWAMANHNEFVAERVELAYRYVHDLISRFVSELNPALSKEQVDLVSVYISASIEGTAVLAGANRAWSYMSGDLKRIASWNLVNLARTITPAEVDKLRHVAAV